MSNLSVRPDPALDPRTRPRLILRKKPDSDTISFELEKLAYAYFCEIVDLWRIGSNRIIDNVTLADQEFHTVSANLLANDPDVYRRPFFLGEEAAWAVSDMLDQQLQRTQANQGGRWSESSWIVETKDGVVGQINYEAMDAEQISISSQSAKNSTATSKREIKPLNNVTDTSGMVGYYRPTHLQIDFTTLDRQVINSWTLVKLLKTFLMFFVENTGWTLMHDLLISGTAYTFEYHADPPLQSVTASFVLAPKHIYNYGVDCNKIVVYFMDMFYKLIMMEKVYSFEADYISGTDVPLGNFRMQVI